MLKQAVTHYNDLLSEGSVAERSLEALNSKLDEAKLIFGGRSLSPYLRPHFVTEPDWARVVKTCETIWGTLQKVKNAAVNDDAILSELGLTEIERELVKFDPVYSQVSPTPRLDSFLRDEAY